MPRVILIAFPGARTVDLTGPAEVLAAAQRHTVRNAYDVVIAARGVRSGGTTSGCRVLTRDLERLRPRSDDTCR